MDHFSDPALKLKYRKCKFKVKQWESEFRDKCGTNPSKDDIREAPTQIREAYKWYWRLKIHALGQDSLIDATFVDSEVVIQTNLFNSSEVTVPSIVDNVNDISNIHMEMPHAEADFSQTSDRVSLSTIPVELGVQKSLKDIQVEMTDNVKSSSELKVSESLDQNIQTTKDNLSKDKRSVLDESSEQESMKVWGPHLNNSTKNEKKSERLSLPRSSSFQLAEKLFHGSKFRKRNPRKSLSFCNGKTKSMSSIPSTEILSQLSDSSCALDCSQDDGFPVDALNKDNAGPNFVTSNFVVVKRHVTPSAQPIGAVQKLLEDSVLNVKSKPEWKLDKGWIDRINLVDQLSCTDQNVKDDPGHVKHSSKIDPIDVADCSDDDIIYDSDTDCKETDQNSRLNVLSNVMEETKSNKLTVPSTTEVGLEHPKKRKLDAVEAALTVLSERQSTMKMNSQSLRRPRTLSSSFEEDEARTGIKKEMPEDETVNVPKPKKRKLTKAEILEKKVASGTVNDNFVRINMKKKVFVRGKKTMNFQKYKKQQWMRRKKEVASEASAAYASKMDPSDSAAGGGLSKCFNCGDVGHFARSCLKLKGDSLLPNDDLDIDESPFPSLAEVEKMAQERIGLLDTKSLQTTSVTTQVLQVEKFLNNPSDIEDSKLQLTNAKDIDSSSEKNFDFGSEDSNFPFFKESEHVSNVSFGSVKPLFPLNQDGSVMKTPSEVFDCLHMFGHQNFRPGQEEAIMRILSGLSTLVTLSTGSGKSLCYQLPAYMYASHNKCITLVVSPLVSLMDDQVTGLPSFLQAMALHTGQTEKQREKVLDMIKSGMLQFLLVSPEAVVAGERQTGFGRILRELPDIAFACIDEVHCTSQWSHNFRPSYLMLCKVLREKLGVRTILGLTATATHSTVKSIIELLHIPDGFHGVIQDVPLPNNLLLTTSRDSNRDQALVDLLSSERFQSFESIIIYCTRREECERVSGLLRIRLKDLKAFSDPSKKQRISSNAEAYHAGLSAARRKQVQNAFMTGKLRIVVATVAFGMGINKANIRAVIHYNMPGSFESYVQEVGRAGRDGKSSHCHLFLNNEGRDLCELRRHIFADSLDRHTIRKLLQRVFVPCKCSKALVSGNAEGDSTSDKGQAKMFTSKEQDDGTFSSNKLICRDLDSCKGHEVAFSIESTIQALDLPEENILTLLCYLELHDQHLIEVLPKAYILCKVQSYRGMKHIRHVAKTCPPLAMAVAMDLMNENRNEQSNTLEFPVIEIANAINWDSGSVKRDLINLEWMKVGGQSRRSGLKVEFSDLGFRVKAPGNLPPDEMDAALDFMYQRVNAQENTSLYQLELIYNSLTGVSFSDIHSMMASSGMENHSEALKQTIRSYFQVEHIPLKNTAAFGNLENDDQIANDIRQLVNSYRDCNFTGRAVARIFHGISSPNFPAQVWGRCRFWRSHLDSDFKLICQLATHVLLKMR